jgi:ubiquitin-conjugating enzyme E2 variant
LIAPFREHHADALAMTRHDFFEISGNNGLATIPLAIGILVLPPPTSLLMQWLAATSISLGFSIVATNQFHCWAHVAVPPRWVRPLQSWGLILSPKRHALHHRPEHDRAYCVTSGWLNPVLDRLRVFARLERSLERLRRKPNRIL